MFRFHRRLESAFLRDRCHRLSLLRLGASQFARPSRRRRVALRDERRLGGDASPLRRVSRALGVGDFPRRLLARGVRGRELRRALRLHVALLLDETFLSVFLLRELLREPRAKRAHLLVDAPPFARRKLAGGGDERLGAAPPARRRGRSRGSRGGGPERARALHEPRGAEVILREGPARRRGGGDGGEDARPGRFTAKGRRERPLVLRLGLEARARAGRGRAQRPPPPTRVGDVQRVRVVRVVREPRVPANVVGVVSGTQLAHQLLRLPEHLRRAGHARGRARGWLGGRARAVPRRSLGGSAGRALRGDARGGLPARASRRPRRSPPTRRVISARAHPGGRAPCPPRALPLRAGVPAGCGPRPLGALHRARAPARREMGARRGRRDRENRAARSNR